MKDLIDKYIGSAKNEAMSKGSLSWMTKIKADLEKQGFSVELKELSLGDHKVLKVKPTSTIDKLSSWLDHNYKFGAAGNGLKYKVNKKKNEIIIYSWDLEIDKKWKNIWK